MEMTIQKIIGVLHLDSAVVRYQVACALCAAGLLHRIPNWFRCPPNRTLWGRSAQAWSSLPGLGRLAALVGSTFTRLVFQTYITRRGRLRWLTHFFIAWGAAMAAGGSLALVLGSRKLAPAIVPGSLLLLGGLILALWQRFAVRRSETLERPREHLGTLCLLLAVTVSGLLVTVSYKYLDGSGYDILAGLHEIVVVLGLLWLPFGKLFHLAVSPAAVALDVTERAGVVEPSRCSCCHRTLSAVWRPSDMLGAFACAGLAPREGGLGPAESTLCPFCRQRRQAALLRLGSGRSFRPVTIMSELRDKDGHGSAEP